MSRLGAQVCAWAVLVACATGPLLAHEAATGVVKERMDQMKEMGRSMKRINDRLKSKRDLTGIAADAERVLELEGLGGRVERVSHVALDGGGAGGGGGGAGAAADGFVVGPGRGKS